MDRYFADSEEYYCTNTTHCFISQKLIDEWQNQKSNTNDIIISNKKNKIIHLILNNLFKRNNYNESDELVNYINKLEKYDKFIMKNMLK